MAERRATNKYYPPDWTPDQGSLNTFVGQHPLRDRAKRLDEGILVIRFELPYNIWCDGCGNHVAKGVRYNAQKKKVGMYYTTPIFSFRMKCHLCDNWFEIRTDPQARDYVITEGARRKEETWDVEEAGTFILDGDRALDDDVAKRRSEHALARLEHSVDDERKGKTLAGSTADLITLRDADWKDDYESSRLLRKQFREKRKVWEAEAEEASALAQRGSLSIPILPKSNDDAKAAAQVLFRKDERALTEPMKRTRIAIKTSGIFDNGYAVGSKAKVKGASQNGQGSKAAWQSASAAGKATGPAQLALLARAKDISYKNFRPLAAESAVAARPSALDLGSPSHKVVVVKRPPDTGGRAATSASSEPGRASSQVRNSLVDYEGSDNDEVSGAV